MLHATVAMTRPGSPYAGWHLFWLIWFAGSIGVFLVVEIYAVVTDWRRTLSAAIWELVDLTPGQPVSHWTVGHLWFVGLLGLLFVWLFFHFALGWWR